MIKKMKRHKIYELNGMIKVIKQICIYKNGKNKHFYNCCVEELKNLKENKKKLNKIIMRKKIKPFYHLIRIYIANYDHKKNINENSKCKICKTKEKLTIHHNHYMLNRKIKILCKQCHINIHKTNKIKYI